MLRYLPGRYVPAMDHASLLQLLGLATARGQQLELLTAHVLARTLNVSESSARLLASSMGLGAALGVLQTLEGRGECGSMAPGDLEDWLPVAKAAVVARNRLVHTPWVANDGGIPESVVVRGSMMLESRSEADIRGDIDQIAAAVESASVLLGHWPQREPSPVDS